MTTANLKFLFGAEPTPEVQLDNNSAGDMLREGVAAASETTSDFISATDTDAVFASLDFGFSGLEFVLLGPETSSSSDFDFDRLVMGTAGGAHADSVLAPFELTDTTGLSLEVEAMEPYGMSCEVGQPSVISSDFVIFIG